MITFPPPMERELERILADGPAGLVVAAWRPEEFDTGSRVKFVLNRHRHEAVFSVGESALSAVLGPLRSPAEAEGLGHQLVEDLRALELIDEHQSSPSSWVVAVVTSRRGDSVAALERYLNHAVYEGWLYGLKELSIFDDEDRPILEVGRGDSSANGST